MNIYLSLGILVMVAYLVGRLFARLGFPKIIGYILTGIAFSPNTFGWTEPSITGGTDALLTICLSFIAFEVGGELQWSRIKKQENVIVSITLLESLTPFFLVIGGFYLLYLLAPGTLPIQAGNVALAFAILLASLACPTDPTATLAVIHEYKAKGKVQETILGVAAHDDALGVLLFTLSVSLAFYLIGDSSDIGTALLEAFLHIGGAVLVGVVAAGLLNFSMRLLKDEQEGQWIVVIFSTIALCYGAAAYFGFDEIFACMIMGVVVTNASRQRGRIFNTLERYTEELIFLFFFVLSGLKLEIQSLTGALLLIALYVLLRAAGKFGGAYMGASLAGAETKVRRYTGGGLIPQGGIVIGLALALNRYEGFTEFFDLLLAVVMGATVIHELVGPLLAKQTLTSAGEIGSKRQKPVGEMSRVTRSREEARRAYNRLSSIYDRLIHPFERTSKDRGLKLLDARPGETILEIGFGTGNNLLQIAAAVGEKGRVYGIDIADKMVEVTRAKLEAGGLRHLVDLRRGDALKLPYEDSYFDAVFLSFVLDLFDNPDLPLVLGECRRVLKSEGRLVNVSLQQAGNLPNHLYVTIHETFPRLVDCRPIPAAALLEEAGFRIEKEERMSMFGLQVGCVRAVNR